MRSGLPDPRLRPDLRFWVDRERWSGKGFWPRFVVRCDHHGRNGQGLHPKPTVGVFATRSPAPKGEDVEWVPAYGIARGRKGDKGREALFFADMSVLDEGGNVVGKGTDPQAKLVARTLDGDGEDGWLPPLGWTWTVEMRCDCGLGQRFSQAKLVPILNALRSHGCGDATLYTLIQASARAGATRRRR